MHSTSNHSSLSFDSLSNSPAIHLFRLIYRSRDAVVTPCEEGNAVEENSEGSKQNNSLGVTITISPPTPVQGHRCIVGATGNAADEEESPESYEVIELKDDENTAETSDSADGQAPSGPAAKQEKEESDTKTPPESEDQPKSWTSQESTTTKVITSTTKIITETEIITLNELNEEVYFYCLLSDN